MSDDFIPPPMPKKKGAEFWELLDAEPKVSSKPRRAFSNGEFGEWRSGSHTTPLIPDSADDFISEDDYIDF